MTIEPCKVVRSIAGLPSVGFSDLPVAMQQRIARYRTAAKADNTTRTYAAQFRQFQTWCGRQGLAATLPVPAVLAAAWLTDRADHGASRATIAVACAALKAAHADADVAFEGDDPLLLSTMQGLRRTLIQPQRQVAPLKSDLLAALLTNAGDTDRGIRNAALVASLYAFGFRRSELAGLDYAVLGGGSGVIIVQATTINVMLAKSKNRHATVKHSSIQRDANPLAFAAIERWVKHADIGKGTPFMRRLVAHGGIGGRLTGGCIARIVKNAVLRHLVVTGTPLDQAIEIAATFSGHSGRIGLVVSAKEAGASDSAIASATRHKNLAMVARYGEQADLIQTTPHKLPGVGV